MTYRKYRDIVPFNVRMQPTLKKQIDEAAKGKPKWSINAEIVQRLEESFAIRDDISKFSDGELIDELIKRWGRDRVLIRLGDDKT